MLESSCGTCGDVQKVAASIKTDLSSIVHLQYMGKGVTKRERNSEW